MAHPVCEVLLSEGRIATPPDAFANATGGVVDFWGVVRDLEDGRAINGILYEAHRAMAEYQLRAIAQEAISEFKLHEVTVQHRIGFVPAGEPSLFVRVGSRHRAAAFRGSMWIVDELKKRAPIWKRPAFAEAPLRQAQQEVVETRQ